MVDDYDIIYMQLYAMDEYNKKHNTTIEDYLKLDEKFHLHEFVADNYDLLNMYGPIDMINMIEEFMEANIK